MTDAASLFEQIDLSLGTLYAAFGLVSSFFLKPVLRATRNNLLSAGKASSIPFHQGYINSPALCHSLVCREPDTQGITWAHHISDILLIGLSDKGMTGTLDLSVKRFGFWWEETPYLGVLLQLIHQINSENCRF